MGGSNELIDSGRGAAQAVRPTGDDALARPHGEIWPIRWGVRFVLVAVVLTVVVVVALWQGPRELARWRLAAAVEHQRNGDLQAALAAIDNAIELDQTSADLFRWRSELRMEAGRLADNADAAQRAFEASLDDAHRAVELAGGDPQNIKQRSTVLQHLGRHREAVDDWDTIVSLLDRTPIWLQALNVSNDGLYSAYNGRAYARALGGIELDQALADIEDALLHLPDEPALLDTRGFLRLQRGELRAAMIDLDAAVRGAEWQYVQWNAVVERDRWQITDPRVIVQRRKDMERNVAVIRYHRALAWQKLHAPYYADRDLRRVRELGYEPGDHLF